MTGKIERGTLLPPEIVDDLTRREFLIGAGLLAFAPGCGNSEESGENTSANARVVEHRFGETEVAVDAARIVTVGLYDQDAVYALGERPVASQAWYEERVIYPWAEEEAPEATTEILASGDINIESVAAQSPDLILAISADITESEYGLLSEVAPTVAGAPGVAADEQSWQEQTMMVGRALGREIRARELVAETRRKFAEAAERHPEWEGASAVLASQYLEGRLLVYPAGTQATYFLESLGFTIAPGLDEFMSDVYNVPTISPERFDLIDVDLILWDGDREALEASGLFDLPLYENLDAVKEGRQVFPPGEVADSLAFRNVLSLPWALERLVPQIEAAVDGDPETEVEGAS